MRNLRFVVILIVVAAASLASNLPARAETGAWKERVHTLWNRNTGELFRHTFRVWDAHPEKNMDFLWEPRSLPDPKALRTTANGPGTLSWRTKGSPNYDRRFIYSVFKGTLKDGRADGLGVLATKAGWSYTGQWVDGLMHGEGIQRKENGDKYNGHFVRGKFDGFGKYVSADGSIYSGDFSGGKRHGSGKLVTTEGSYQIHSEQGEEVSRKLIARAAPAKNLHLATTSGGVRVRISMNQTLASEFEVADPDVQTHSYEADFLPGSVSIRLGSKAMLDIWKGKADQALTYRDTMALSYFQFAPVFISANVQNERTTAVQIVSAHLEVEESVPDLTPYIEIYAPSKGCEPIADFAPVVEIRNRGWGRVENAKFHFTLGNSTKRTAKDSVSLGDFQVRAPLSISDRLRKFGVNVERLRKASSAESFSPNRQRTDVERFAFRCERPTNVGADEDEWDKANDKCFEEIRKSGELGKFSDFAFRSANRVYTNLAGHLEYNWQGSDGKQNKRFLPLGLDVPLLTFNLELGEMGCESPIARKAKTVALAPDRRNYKIPLGGAWKARIEPNSTKHFELNLSSEKSSTHKFTLVVELSNGSKSVSPVMDLSYFRPRR